MNLITNIKRIDDKTVEFQYMAWRPIGDLVGNSYQAFTIKGTPGQTKRFLRKYGEGIENKLTWARVKFLWKRFKILGI